MMQNILEIVKILIAMATVAGALIPLIPWIRAKVTTEQWKQMLNVIHALVVAAEQTIKGEKRGIERMKEVTRVMASEGYNTEDEKVKAAIEAEVSNLPKTKGE